jgi:nucleoside-diphosphate-sugar epimerase
MKNILITGASFIGSHLIKRLIDEKVSSITVINLSNKHKKNLKPFLNEISFQTADLRDYSKAKKIIKGCDIVFHLAADHGGRGYVNLKQGNTVSNLLLDGSVFKACLENDVEKVFFASSGCVYPNYAQANIHKKIYLKESDVKPPYDADNMYGWAKLMGELTLKQYYKDFGLKSAIGRFFTVYGPQASESHAVMATIAKAYIRQDPFEVWGDGNQIRNWTYVDDIIDGIIMALKSVDDASAINLGTEERIRVNSIVKLVLKQFHYNPTINYQTNMPIGPLNRVADNTLAKQILHWTPKFTFNEGLKKTIDWYIQDHDVRKVKTNLDRLLI